MRQKRKRQERPKIDEEEVILKERERLLESARNEQNRLEQLKFQQDETQGLIDKLKKEEQKLEMRVEALEIKKEHLETLEQELVDKKDVLIGETDSLEANVKNLTENKERIEKELEERRHELNKVYKERDVLKVEKEDLNKIIEFKEVKLKELDNDYDLKMQERDTFIDEVKEQKEELNKIQDEIREGLVLRDKQFTDWDKKIQEAETKHQDIKGDIAKEELELSHLKDTNADFEKDLVKRMKELEVKEEALDKRGKFLNEVAESLRVEANKVRAKDLDKSIEAFLKGK